MERTPALKALADETRMKLVELLLRHDCCVRALAKRLGVSEAAVSQHVKVLREAGLVNGERRGYFMHYQVRRETLRELGAEIAALADVSCEEREAGCGCRHHKEGRCRCGTNKEEEKE